MTALATIAEQLRVRIGLDPAILGARALAHTVRRRLQERGLDPASEAAYLEILAADPAEWEALVEAVVVPETWFFRDREPFALLGRWAAAAAAPGIRTDPFTVLSLPCSTGEEAWSIAIALAAAGLAPGAFRVEGFDLSRRALSHARDGLYSGRSLRRQRLAPEWSRYLVARADGGFEIAPELRPAVEFSQGNLIRAGSDLAGRRFDCIFSRNLLIYCDAATRAAALATFAAGLRPGGLLFLGHAETMPVGVAGFEREGPPSAFAWRRTTTTRRPATVARGRTLSPLRRAERPERLPRPSPAASISPAKPTPTVISQARALADLGRLDDSAALAAGLEQAPHDAAAQALLGVVRAAQGRDAEAAEHLRRALYLDPSCEEALIHLPLVLERLGESGAAARVRRQARRLEEGR